MKVRSLFFLLILVLWQTPCFALVKGVIINEFVASNKDGIKDEDNENSDWIELYNTNSVEVHVSGWSLTDDISEPQKWLFPDVTLEGGEYLIVFASEKNRRIIGKELHTNFKLSASGEYLALFSPDGLAESELNPFPPQETDHSYGILNGIWIPFNVPTPGVSNNINAFTEYPAPHFSHDHGFFEHPFTLSITCPLSKALIYYTTDGSIPSKTNGFLYSNSINVTGTTILRAIAVDGPIITDSIKDSKVTTRTFLFADDIVRQTNTPAGYPDVWGKYSTISGTAIADYEMDPELMAEAGYQAKVRTAFMELPVVSLVTDKNNLFNNVNNELTGGIYIFTDPPVGTGAGIGKDWERPASFEYFFAQDNVSLQADCGLQLHGGHSRLPEKCPKHSFRLDFQAEYGLPKLNYPLFGNSEASEINSFFLRAGFADAWVHQSSNERSPAVYTRDAWAKRIQKRMGSFYSNTQFAHLFINGIYWGLYNPMERLDDDFCVTYLGGEKGDYDIIKVDEPAEVVYASNGTLDAWNRLISMVGNASDMTVFQKVQGNNPNGTPNAAYECLLDMENYIDYMLINYYGGNTDWDNHNWVALRNRVNPGKGFKFLCWDTEKIFSTLNYNNLSLNKSNCPSYIFQQLKNNPLFCRLVGDRVQKHCFGNGSLSPTGAAEVFTSLADIIDKSMYAESARWGDYRRDVHPWQQGPYNLYRKDTYYDAQKSSLLGSYFPNRTNTFISQLKSAGLFPSINAPVYKINNVDVTNDTINQGATLSISATQGNIYYTLDGSDPVVWSQNGTGVQSSSGLRYTSAWAPDNNVHIKARALYSSTWSALNERTFVVRGTTAIENRYNLWSEVTVKNFPNPFRDQTTFNYSIPVAVDVQMDIYDLSGRKVSTVINDYQEAGNHSILFDGSGLMRGIYLCRFVVKGAFEHQVVFRISKL